MSDLSAAAFFDLVGFAHAEVFSADQPVWAALGPRLDDYLASWPGWRDTAPAPPGVHVLEGPVAFGDGCRIEPGVVLRGPVIVSAGAEIRTGAYLRGGVIVGAGCVVGAHTEVKRAILLDGAHAPHQNYVGDSILGRKVNLGAGTILSNVKNVGVEVTFPCEGRTVHTGLRKFGAVLGDGCRTGCNTVANPGVLMGPGCVTYPSTSVRSGVYPPRTLIKLRQVQQQVVLDALRHR
jgi:UDP-N-acetylglucosamine diphosphorylase / glucose-1-phosphate thymidylyltransferase / UDP-N-acetylgalactosamine diphosphorylase / glucosamine-1-phosphate N-acetyltransferase / galactosamine-1-phosphate N-acetyltransferase